MSELHILLVEDNAFQADLICDGLCDGFRGARVTHLSTESEFRTFLPNLVEDLPDIAIVDIMLRWADPEPSMLEPPEDVESNGYHRAGLRCQSLLQNNSATSRIPVILFTVLEAIDLEGDLPTHGTWVHLRKVTSINPLIEEVRRLTSSRGR